MSAFQTGTACMQRPDPLKRMNYTFGMVLGVDEFRQEQAYLVEKDRSQYRQAHGYGTLSGLRVSIDSAPELQVRISKGTAVNPQGQEIHVCREMCARLNDWLTTNRDALHDVFGAPPLPLSLSVVLCYRDCPTDSVPIPGEACRSQQDAMAPSHIAESFQLKLCLDTDQITSPAIGSPSVSVASGLCFRPAQVEENAARAFGTLLRQIRVTGIPPSSVSRAELEDMVRQLAAGPSQDTSPAGFSAPIHLFVDDAPDYLRAASLVWITEVRPTYEPHAAGCSCGCAGPSEDCVLLADLHFDVAVGWQVLGPVVVDESRRPFLVETRILQEALLTGAGGGAGAAGGPVIIAAGTFLIGGGSVSPGGPVFNGLQAAAGVSPGTYLLSWSGSPAYENPAASSPGSHTYVVKGTALAGPAKSRPYVLQVAGFQNEGILIEVIGAAGNDQPAGFTVEITAVTGGFA